MNNSGSFDYDVSRWNEVTMGIQLSGGEQILLKDETAIIVGTSAAASTAIVTYRFDPANLSERLQNQFAKINNLVLWFENVSRVLSPVPAWLPSLTKIERLGLLDMDVSNLSICRDLPLKYLDMRNVLVSDNLSLIETIGTFLQLEYFIYDRSISKEGIELLRKKLPRARFATKDKY